MADNSHLRGAEFNFPGEMEGGGRERELGGPIKSVSSSGRFSRGFVHRRLRKPTHRVHASVIYVISEVFFGSIRLERRARTRARRRGATRRGTATKPRNRFNVKQFAGQLRN